MNENTRAMIQSTFDASSKGLIHFGQVIEQLMSVQVEAYHVDYRSGRATYYLSNDSTLDLSFEQPEAIAEAFDGASVRAAILGAPSRAE